MDGPTGMKNKQFEIITFCLIYITLTIGLACVPFNAFWCYRIDGLMQKQPYLHF